MISCSSLIRSLYKGTPCHNNLNNAPMFCHIVCYAQSLEYKVTLLLIAETVWVPV